MPVPNVTTEECQRRHITHRWWIGGIAILLCPLLITASLTGYTATHSLETHKARQNGSLETIGVRLQNIERSIDRNHQKVEEILQKMHPQKP